jgi:hypothetical protein
VRETTYTAIRERRALKWLKWPKWLARLRWYVVRRRELLEDYEKHNLDQVPNTAEYLQAVLSVRAAQEQQRWAIVAAVAACLSVAVAVAALVVALS